MTDAGGIVLAGGRSERMGTPKAWLDWHGTPLLYRTVTVLGRAVTGPVVVVRAAGQDLPALPAGTEVVDDPVPGLGPLPAVGVGCGVLAGRAEVAFVASVDLPLLTPAFAARVLAAARDEPGVDVVLPVARGHHQPLAAAYRTAMAGPIAALCATGDARPPSLFARCRVRRLDEPGLLADPVLRARDPDLASLTNVNTPEQYAAALARAAPTVRVGDRTQRAFTVADVLAGLPDGSRLLLDGTEPDPHTPLVEGDEIQVR